MVSHPAISEAAVVGVPDKLAYEAVAAYVIPAAGRTITAPKVQRWVAERMADYAVPRQVRHRRGGAAEPYRKDRQGGPPRCPHPAMINTSCMIRAGG